MKETIEWFKPEKLPDIRQFLEILIIVQDNYDNKYIDNWGQPKQYVTHAYWSPIQQKPEEWAIVANFKNPKQEIIAWAYMPRGIV